MYRPCSKALILLALANCASPECTVANRYQPKDRRNCYAPTLWLLCTALRSPVPPQRSGWLTFAPLSSSSFTTPTLPSHAAKCSAVRWSARTSGEMRGAFRS
eukprot:6186173-Pleurochrysis_carterae.AAC.6